jgi:membrane protein
LRPVHQVVFDLMLWGFAMLSFGQIKDLLVETFNDWNEDKAPRLAAALSYYTIFSLAPLLIIVISIAGLVFGQDAARGEVIAQVSSFMGEEGAEAISGLLEASNRPTTGTIAAIIGFVTLLFGAAGVFSQLKDALNTIWEVAPKPNQGVWGFIRGNLLSFSMVLGIGFLLLVSLLISTVISAAGKFLGGDAIEGSIIWGIVNFLIQGLITFGLFALIFRELPDAEITWRDVFLGAAFTALLFAIGRFAISFYLAQTATGSTFGAAGSLVVILVWVYLSAQILFFGAEFTQVYARRYGSRIRPAANAVPATEDMRAEQGMPDPQIIAATTDIAEGRMPQPIVRNEGDQASLAEQVEQKSQPARSAPAPQPVSQPASQVVQPKDSTTGTVLAGVTIFGILGVLARAAGRKSR